ncbi:pyruvate ferredoxin oxidoreductase [Zongyangia sp. HA2173]|uniref:pyruvate ferredoxin oxidoreductase n=1 Tax=Zongyangia sp. HA2173 TaxID=3133035 RepID=UPI0031685441
MSHYKMLDGNAAAVEAMKMARVKVISAYPITPQSSISEKLSDLVDAGELDAKYIRVESEHTAMSCAVGAQLTGVRAATATSSVGLALMHEILNVASGCRVPIVMPVVNRSLASPWSLWCDHQDSMAERDSGWLQFYCENVQDVFDTLLCAYRIAEDRRVQTPAMVCLDGFFLSHSMQKVLLPEQDEVDGFLGEYTPKNAYLNPADPMVINDLTPTDEITEMKFQQAVGFAQAKVVAGEVFAAFAEEFGRHKEVVEGYRAEDADAIIITQGSMSGTAKYVVDKLREEGQKVGAVKIVMFRPFPYEALRQACGSVKKVAVLDRTAGLGAQGTPLWLETKAALDGDVDVRSYVGGLAGRDISPMTIQKVFEDLGQEAPCDGVNWIDCKDDPMHLREVPLHV